MPLVQVKVIEGVFSAAQKREMIGRLTDSVLAVAGEAMRAVTWVVVEEVGDGEWAIGGSPLTTLDVKSIQAASAAR